MSELFYQVNVPRLKGVMAENDCNISRLADKIGLSRNTMSMYLRCPDKLPYAIMNKMISALHMSEEQARDVFFTRKLTDTQGGGDDSSTNRVQQPANPNH